MESGTSFKNHEDTIWMTLLILFFKEHRGVIFQIAVNQSINEAEVNEASDSNFCKIKYMIIEYILEYYELPDLHPRNQEHPRKSGQMTKPMIAQFGDSEKCLI